MLTMWKLKFCTVAPSQIRLATKCTEPAAHPFKNKVECNKTRLLTNCEVEHVTVHKINASRLVYTQPTTTLLFTGTCSAVSTTLSCPLGNLRHKHRKRVHLSDCMAADAARCNILKRNSILICRPAWPVTNHLSRKLCP